MPPNYQAFHESMAAELDALKNRIRNLVTHWGEDGAHKEAVLRSVLRRHLPESVTIGTGFIVGDGVASTQIDILIVDKSKPTLFRDGDMLIVTPDAVRAVIEVKTNFANVSLPDALKKLAKIAKLCERPRPRSWLDIDATPRTDIERDMFQRAERDMAEARRVWTGIFEYEGGETDHSTVLKALRDAHATEHAVVDGLSLGGNHFFLHWRADVMAGGPANSQNFWRSYEIPRLAPAYFLGNLVFACSGKLDQPGSYAWFPLPGTGKEQHRRKQIAPGMTEPEDAPNA